MKKIAILLIAGITLSSFGFNKPDKIERRKGVMTVDAKGKVVFTPLEDWNAFKPVNDTLFQYRVN